MNTTILISLENIFKKYRLFDTTHDRLREILHPFRKKVLHREFWALKDIHFQVAKGSTVGIIGRNGSGKSTLLQILAGIVQPTAGRVRVHGRVTALLELGAGFNPDFTGRENVLLHGALMGFSELEIRKRLPSIEAFADIGQFIDQPVKTYSSGMFVRLAFAAAINVDPDILIIDEALAVGDAKFQHKCYQKFHEFQREGKTIIFVTHDMHAIVKHSNYAILLEHGRILEMGNPKDIVNYYHNLILTGSAAADSPRDQESQPAISHGAASHGPTELEEFIEEIPETDQCPQRQNYNKDEYRYGDKRAELLDYLIVSQGQYDPTVIHSGDWIDIYLKARFNTFVEHPMFGFSLKTIDGIVVYGTNSRFQHIPIDSVKASEILIIKLSIKLDLSPGHYFFDLGVAEKNAQQDVPLDVRCGAVHLSVFQTHRFDGLTELRSTLKEITRRKAKDALCETRQAN